MLSYYRLPALTKMWHSSILQPRTSHIHKYCICDCVMTVVSAECCPLKTVLRMSSYTVINRAAIPTIETMQDTLLAAAKVAHADMIWLRANQIFEMMRQRALSLHCAVACILNRLCAVVEHRLHEVAIPLQWRWPRLRVEREGTDQRSWGDES